MPRLSQFYGIVVYMYWKDHQPPHFHAIYGEDEVLVRIDDATVLVGSLHVPRLGWSGTGPSYPALSC